MYSLTEEGDLIEDLSSDPLIPGYMSSGSFSVKRDWLYAAGAIETDSGWEKGVALFDGRKWALL